MKKTNYIIFNTLAVLGYFYGVLLIASIIGIPLGIYSIIAALRYSAYSEMSEVDLANNKGYIFNWIVFGAVLYFPFGLIGLIILKNIDNNVQVSNVVVEEDKKSEEESQSQDEQKPTEVEISQPTTQEEKAEKLAKLERFKQNGLITEDEFNQAKAELEE